MRRLSPLLACLVILAACGGDGAAAVDPATVTTCDGLADVGFALLEDTIDLIDGLDAAALAELAASEDTPPQFAAIEARGRELTARGEALGCDPAAMDADLAERAQGLESDTLFGQFIIESVKAGQGSFFAP